VGVGVLDGVAVNVASGAVAGVSVFVVVGVRLLVGAVVAVAVALGLLVGVLVPVAVPLGLGIVVSSKVTVAWSGVGLCVAAVICVGAAAPLMTILEPWSCRMRKMPVASSYTHPS